MKSIYLPISLCALAFVFHTSADAAVLVYDEAVSGDLSDSGVTPTALGSVDVGTNSVTGIMGGSPIDRDIFIFTVPAGMSLTGIEIASYELLSGSLGDEGSFFTVGEGNTIDSPNTAGSLGFALEKDPGALFTASLPAGPGDYTMWIQETAGGEIGYQINLTAVAVPEPSSALLVGLFGLGLCLRRSRG